MPQHTVFEQATACLIVFLESLPGLIPFAILFVFLVSRDCCVALPHDTTSVSAVCDSGIS